MPTPTETPYRIEPCLLENSPLDVDDLVAQLTSLTEQLGARRSQPGRYGANHELLLLEFD